MVCSKSIVRHRPSASPVVVLAQTHTPSWSARGPLAEIVYARHKRSSRRPGTEGLAEHANWRGVSSMQPDHGSRTSRQWSACTGRSLGHPDRSRYAGAVRVACVVTARRLLMRDEQNRNRTRALVVDDHYARRSLAWSPPAQQATMRLRIDADIRAGFIDNTQHDALAPWRRHEATAGIEPLLPLQCLQRGRDRRSSLRPQGE